MMHRREAGVAVPPERMMGPRPGMPPPGMVPRIEGPARYVFYSNIHEADFSN